MSDAYVNELFGSQHALFTTVIDNYRSIESTPSAVPEVSRRTTRHHRHKLLVPQVTVALTIGLALVDRSIAGVIPLESHDHHHVSVASSYMHFQGPVQGPEYEVKVPHVPVDHHGEHNYLTHYEHRPHDGYTVDYVAKPKYEFSYGVEDHHTGDFHGQKESSDGE